MTDTRKPTSFLNYCGDCRGILNEGPKGPNLLGELLYPVTADFDGAVTRVGFSLLPPADGAA